MMKRLIAFFRSFRFKVAAVCVLSICLAAVLSVWLIFKYGLDSQFEQLRAELKTIAKTASLTVNPQTLLQVPLNSQGIHSQAYFEIAQKLRRIKKANPQIYFIYVMGKTAEPGILRFLVDPDPVQTVRKKKNLTSFPGDLYDARIAPEMLKGFDGASADHEIIQDPWGATLSGYAPVFGADGRAIAVLGVDFSAEEVARTSREVVRRGIFVFGFAVLVSLALGWWVSRQITGRVEKLFEGTRRLAAGDLHYQVPVTGGDEIGELGRSFNEMAQRLRQSRRELEEYFYRVAQSFIRILEAKDIYTRGHSDRVGDYAKKIALRMGLSAEEADNLREAAQLHDVGKLNIDGEILNKKTSLTEEEWKKIREHPLVGEEALRPVILDAKMLRVIRHHHERYDGKGYPDGLNGPETELTAQIVSAADVFDAMTSARAYRPRLPRTVAIEELKKNSGTQLNPRVVEVFCQILAEDPLVRF